jgi:hypothetical protein
MGLIHTEQLRRMHRETLVPVVTKGNVSRTLLRYLFWFLG